MRTPCHRAARTADGGAAHACGATDDSPVRARGARRVTVRVPVGFQATPVTPNTAEHVSQCVIVS